MYLHPPYVRVRARAHTASLKSEFWDFSNFPEVFRRFSESPIFFLTTPRPSQMISRFKKEFPSPYGWFQMDQWIQTISMGVQKRQYRSWVFSQKGRLFPHSKSHRFGRTSLSADMLCWGFTGSKFGDFTTGLVEIYMIPLFLGFPKNIILRKKLCPFEDLMSKKNINIVTLTSQLWICPPYMLRVT